MKISVMGTGAVGQVLSSRLVETGHDVMVGTRNVKKKLQETEAGRGGELPFSEWQKANSTAKLGTFEECAAYGEVIINATKGSNSLDALRLAGENNLAGKILIDVSNPLDFSKGMPPVLIEGLNNSNSLGEEIQRTFPKTDVVKTFNTMWCGLMVNPRMIGGGNHINFISGNNAVAKTRVKEIIKNFGWEEENIFDLGDISAARGTEALLLNWVRVMGTLNSGIFNFRLVL